MLYSSIIYFKLLYNIIMGTTAQTALSRQSLTVQYPRFEKARFTVDKKIVLEEKYNNSYIEMISKISAISSSNKKLPLLFPRIEQTHSENFCGIQKSINLIFDYFKFTLYEEIVRRKDLKRNFDEAQLWFLLYRLVQGSSIFQRRKQKSGDIRPRNILIDEKGEVAIVNTLTFPDQLTNYYKSLYNLQKTYLAPQQLAELQLKVKYCKSDPVIAQSFSIGLTIIDAALLYDSEQLYNYQQISFKNYQFQDNLVAFKSMNLSPFFIKTVLNLLQVQHFNRPTPGEVLAILQPYENEIVDLNQFAPDRQKSRQSLQIFQSLK